MYLQGILKEMDNRKIGDKYQINTKISFRGTGAVNIIDLETNEEYGVAEYPNEQLLRDRTISEIRNEVRGLIQGMEETYAFHREHRNEENLEKLIVDELLLGREGE